MKAIDLINKVVVPEQQQNVFVASSINDSKTFSDWFHVHRNEELNEKKRFCLMFFKEEDVL